MELSVREWMIIIGVLLVMAVLLDGYRRVRNERRHRIRVTLSKQAMQRGIHTPTTPIEEENAPPPEIRAELPNGGARVIPKRPRDDLKLDQPVPVLMESVHIPPEPEPEPTPVTATATVDELLPSQTQPPQTGPVALDEAAQDLLAEPVAQPEAEPQPRSDSHQPQTQPRYEPAPAEPVAPPPVRQEPVYREEPAPAVESAGFHNGALPNSAAQEVLIVNVISKDPAGFKGQDLLQILLACDLRFGNMNIFHRYEKPGGKGAVQFSVANLVEPGTFDLDRIDDFSTPGLCFFLALPGPDKAVTAFNYMVETAQVLVKNLNAELRDEAHSVMTQQTIEHCRQRIRDFERKQLTLHL